MIPRVPTIALAAVSLCAGFGSTLPDRLAAPLAVADSRERPLKRLSEYGFFAGDLADLIPVEGVHPYTLNTPLFSDYAQKDRFVYLPVGATMGYGDTEVFDLPVGAVLIKHFSYPIDARDPALGRRLVETRLLKRTEGGWEAWGYTWDEDQTDAEYDPLGAETSVTWVDAEGETRELEYEIPNQFECKSCHSFDGELRPIGPSARQLHGEANPTAAAWLAAGIIDGAPADLTAWPVMDWRAEGASVEVRARAYLDANCGYCHRAEGPASTSGLFLLASTPTGPQIGIRKSPVAAGKGSGGRKYGIYPGKPSKSIVTYRLESVDPAVRMPEVGRSTVHAEGVALVKAWIEAM